MKGYLTSALSVAVLTSLTACSSVTGPVVATEGDVVKYESRCGFHTQPFNSDKSISPISREDPRFPRAAAINRTNGYAAMEFDLSEEGKPININVIESSPGDTFADAAVTSLSNWRYPADPASCLYVRLGFEIE